MQILLTVFACGKNCIQSSDEMQSLPVTWVYICDFNILKKLYNLNV